MYLSPKKMLNALLPLFALCAATCNYVDPYDTNLNSSNFFWVALDETKTLNEYRVVRLTLVDEAGAQRATATGPFDGKYKMIPPPGYAPESFTYVVELRTRSQRGGKISMLMKNAMARGYLSSRYIVKEGEGYPGSGMTVDLALEIKDLKVGYSYGGLDISDIPSMPVFFDLNVDLTHNGIAHLLDDGYSAVLAIAVAKEEDGSDSGLRLDVTKYPPIDEKDVMGIASPDTGWYMLMENVPYRQGAECRFWVFFMRTDLDGNPDLTSLRIFYQDGAIPDRGGVLNPGLVPAYAGVPITDIEAFTVMALPDAMRKGTPYENLSDTFVLTSRSYLFPATQPWQPIGRDKNVANSSGIGYSAFSGVLEGGGYSVYWDDQSVTAVHNYTGLFGYAANASFYDLQLGIENMMVECTGTAFDTQEIATGVLVGGAANCTFKNVSVTGFSLQVDRSGSGTNCVGGLIGHKTGSTQILENVISSVADVKATGGTPTTAVGY